MTEKQASEIMEKTIINGAPHPNTLEYIEALNISIDILGTDYTRNQLKNWILINKYPFLMPTYWNRETMQYETDKDYKYDFTLLDEMPDGWRKAFGEMMCEEIYNALVECDGLDDYRIEDIKEKLGSLRWCSYPSYKEVEEIIDKYSVLSENICIICGKPDVPMTNNGRLSPFCKKCFTTPSDWQKREHPEEIERWIEFRTEDWEEYNNDDENKMLDSYTVKSWSKEYGEKTTRYDISRTANMIRSKYCNGTKIRK